MWCNLFSKGVHPREGIFFFMVPLSTQERIGVGTYYQENLMKCWEGVNILFSDIPY